MSDAGATIRTCVSCGNALVAGARFCGTCGSPVPPSSLAADLAELERLHAGGALDDAEFRTAKARVLADSAPPRPPVQWPVASGSPAVRDAGVGPASWLFGVAAVATVGSFVFDRYRFDSSFVQVSTMWWSRYLLPVVLVGALFALGALGVRRGDRRLALLAAPAGLVAGAASLSNLEGFEADYVGFGWWLALGAGLLATVAGALVIREAWRARAGRAGMAALPGALVLAVLGAACVFVDRYSYDGTSMGRLFSSHGDVWANAAAALVLVVVVAVPVVAGLHGGRDGGWLLGGAGLVPLAMGDGLMTVSGLSGEVDFRGAFAVVRALAVAAAISGVVTARAFRAKRDAVPAVS